MSSWKDAFIEVDGKRLHYYRTGGNKPQVVINHGAGDDGLCWTHVVKELEADYDVILPDARGHGKSAAGKGDYSTASRVADLAGLVRALKLDRPVVGGHSMGADTSLHYAAQYPGKVRAVFLEDPPIVAEGEPLFAVDAGGGKDMGQMMKRFMLTFRLLPKFIGRSLARKAMPSYPDDEIEPWIDSKKRLSFDFLRSLSIDVFLTGSAFDTASRLRVPTLLIIGDKEKMSIVSVKTADKLAKLNNDLRVVHLAGASHDIRRTRFDGYMPALKQFLGEIYSG